MAVVLTTPLCLSVPRLYFFAPPSISTSPVSIMASSTVVLVPGAWHQPSCMRQLQDELTSRGINATTVAHPSIGNTSPPLKTMVDDRASLHAVIEELADKGHYVTVVAHSYGGAVASGAAEGLGVAERRAAGKAGGIVMIVYLVAFVVPKGQTLLGYFGGVAPSFWEFKVGSVKSI